MSSNSTSNNRPIYRVAVLLFPNADILDYAGPIEALSHATWNRDRAAPEPIFEIHTTGRATDVPIPTGDAAPLKIQPSILIEELLDTLPSYHILVVPGGPPAVVQKVADQADGLELRVVREFAELAPPQDGTGLERVLMSVCTGAFLLGKVGVLAGLTVTTHHMFLDVLDEVCNKDNTGKKTEVVGGRRFVDAGLARDGLRIVTAGGVSSGLDAALHVVELVSDGDKADYCAKVMEYERRKV
ncbi:hypothetical protein EPUS_03111 [Endocarpon pusillum Z07020]|uniref:DJ-1/PfpI domain-containing protein n=1 Tax=Endocarpon pusillum (strain Z07020 / HMAS-L-300199) TaxID=1263415 RepID=U1HVA4_ENDPU|nr:uncharacterized protein EPUS_03111 [Endocarpon pusillum Z07020]ERF73279.1 hypothetical protein EPUS_03111 [Endocarpon pusillum Z07020]